MHTVIWLAESVAEIVGIFLAAFLISGSSLALFFAVAAINGWRVRLNRMRGIQL